MPKSRCQQLPGELPGTLRPEAWPSTVSTSSTMNNRHPSPRSRRLRSSSTWCGALAVCLFAARGLCASPDWKRIGDDAANLLSEAIRIDTSNPPGNETPAASLLANRLAEEGIPAEVFESVPGRGNLHARLAGQGG